MSFLITGGNNKQQKKGIKKLCRQHNFVFKTQQPDFLAIKPDKSIGIDQIKQIKTFLYKTSWQNKKLVVVWDSHLMTVPAQNAILKILEEPPQDSLIILVSNNENSLLPTIISRCYQIKIITQDKLDNSKKAQENWQEISNAKLMQKLDLISKLKQDDIDNLIFYLHKKLISQPSLKLVSFLKTLIKAHSMIQNNVNFSHVKDWIAIQ